MTITEVFPNPTVKKVIFQIRFPNLFFMENKIGEYQLKIMELFPESALLLRRQVVFADIGDGVEIKHSPNDPENELARKIWQFKSNKSIILNILSNSLDISSEHHKTYKQGDDNFRSVIEFVVSNFLAVTNIPLITRIGLRYVDECPIPSKDNETFLSYYNTSFPLNRFSLADASEMEFITVVTRNGYKLRYAESLKNIDGSYKLLLDFDGFAETIQAKDYLTITDDLHTIIGETFEQTIKAPVYDYMRQVKG